LTTYWSHRNNRRAGLKRVVRVSGHLFLISEVFDDFVVVATIGGIATEGRVVLPAVAAAGEDDFACEGADRLCADRNEAVGRHG
jgi:hypothetical protein